MSKETRILCRNCSSLHGGTRKDRARPLIALTCPLEASSFHRFFVAVVRCYQGTTEPQAMNDPKAGNTCISRLFFVYYHILFFNSPFHIFFLLLLEVELMMRECIHVCSGEKEDGNVRTSLLGYI